MSLGVKLQRKFPIEGKPKFHHKDPLRASYALLNRTTPTGKSNVTPVKNSDLGQKWVKIGQIFDKFEKSPNQKFCLKNRTPLL